MIIKSNKGFSLIEALLAGGILILSFIAGLSIFNTIDKGQKGNESSLDFTLVRNQIVSLIIDDTAWAKIIGPPGNAGNPNLSCLLNQNSVVPADRDCFNKTDPFVLYDIKGSLHQMNGVDVFDFHSTTQGFTNKGLACSTFNGTAGAGDPLCPFLMTVTWKAICAASPCVNPPILFQGQATVNGGPTQPPLNTSNLAFEVIKANMYCPPQATPPTTQVASGGGVNVATVDKVKSNQATDVPTTDYGMTDQILAPCRKTTVTFSEDLSTTYTPSANNNSSVFIRDETTGAAVFEFRRIASGTFFDYQLLYNGAVVFATKPTWIGINKSTIFKFQVTNGMVAFCINDRCVFYFPQKLDFPFRFAFRPASGFFTPEGFNMITYTSFDL
jgi:hypothetical protein